MKKELQASKKEIFLTYLFHIKNYFFLKILISTGKKEITIPSDDEPKGIIAPLKEKYSEIKGYKQFMTMKFFRIEKRQTNFLIFIIFFRSNHGVSNVFFAIKSERNERQGQTNDSD